MRSPSQKRVVHRSSLFANVSGRVRIADNKTVCLRLPGNYFEPGTLLSLLRKILTERNR
jgi:hypothetical protein